MILCCSGKNSMDISDLFGALEIEMFEILFLCNSVTYEYLTLQLPITKKIVKHLYHFYTVKKSRIKIEPVLNFSCN